MDLLVAEMMPTSCDQDRVVNPAVLAGSKHPGYDYHVVLVSQRLNRSRPGAVQRLCHLVEGHSESGHRRFGKYCHLRPGICSHRQPFRNGVQVARGILARLDLAHSDFDHASTPLLSRDWSLP